MLLCQGGDTVLELLAAFVEVAHTGSVRRAAEALSLTQPTVSWRLRQLEATLEEPLFVRSRRGMELTEAGRAALPLAERALRSAEEVREAVLAFRRGERGRLVIGATPSVSTYLLPDLLQEFRARHPGVEVVATTGHTEEILQAVLAREVQIGIVRDVQHPRIAATRVCMDEIVLTVGRDHPFARRAEVSIEELGREGLILFERASIFYRMTQTLFAAAAVTPHITMELDSAESAKMMVLKGLGVALLPSMAVRGALRDGSLVKVRIRDAAPIYRQILAIRRIDRPVDRVQEAFYFILQERPPRPTQGL
jgi:DNA-binding transcriptional LysR family regulator